MKEYTVSGYVIVPPLSEWDEQHADKIIPEMSMSTFDPTFAGAWSKKTQTPISDPEYSRRVAAWFDKGYRLKGAMLTIYY